MKTPNRSPTLASPCPSMMEFRMRILTVAMIGFSLLLFRPPSGRFLARNVRERNLSPW